MKWSKLRRNGRQLTLVKTIGSGGGDDASKASASFGSATRPEFETFLDLGSPSIGSRAGRTLRKETAQGTVMLT